MRPLITVDCGNTTIDVLDHRNGVRRWFGSTLVAREELSELLRGAVACRLVVSSVTESSLRALTEAARGVAVNLEVAGKDLPCPISLDYQPASALGSDRWLGAMAAFQLHGASVVVDCGSATTINCIDSEGRFLGGAIAPGLRAMVQGMTLATPALPEAELDGEVEIPAKSTRRSVTSGVLLGYAGMVERLVASSVAANQSDARLVVTGGNADRLLRWTSLRASHVPDLVHRGLAALAGAEP